VHALGLSSGICAVLPESVPGNDSDDSYKGVLLVTGLLRREALRNLLNVVVGVCCCACTLTGCRLVRHALYALLLDIETVSAPC